MTLDPTPPAFHHTDAGTSEAVWLGSDHWSAAGALDLPALARRHPHVVVAAAHPDDETLGVGALVADLSDAGTAVHVVVASDGERSHPVADDADRRRLAALRRREVDRALDVLAPGASVDHLGFPDTGLEHHERAVREAVARRCRPGSLVLAPWVHDGHGDHDAVGRACAGLAGPDGPPVAYYPIWLWHWAGPDHLPWERVVAVEPSRSALWRKRSALSTFRSQVTPRGGPEVDDDGAAPVLGGAVLARAERVVETLIDPDRALPVVTAVERTRSRAESTATFDAMYDEGPDPWRFEGSFYEERRRALVLAALGRRRFDRVLEIGCAGGHLTAELVHRAGEVVALDPSPRAVAAASRRAPSARAFVGGVPEDLPPGPFDLVVLSEVGYFLRPLDLIATLRGCEAALAADGELVLCHWTHPTTDVPLDGRLVHDQAHSMLRRRRAFSARDDDLLVEVWRDGPSVAAAEGRT